MTGLITGPVMFIGVRIFSVPHPDHPAAVQMLAVADTTLFHIDLTAMPEGASPSGACMTP